jgi:ribosomal protein S27E
MPNVTEVLVRCADCGHMWHLPLSAPLIGASNGDTISFPSGSIEVECPVCGTVGINDKETRAQVLGKEIRGLYAILRSVSLKGDDLRKLAAIAAEAKESGSRPEEVAEKIKATVPTLQPVLAWIAENNISIATWLALLAALVMPIVGPEIAAALWPPTTTVVVETPSGEEHLLEQIARELRSSLHTSSSTDSPDVESKPGARSDRH